MTIPPTVRRCACGVFGLAVGLLLTACSDGTARHSPATQPAAADSTGLGWSGESSAGSRGLRAEAPRPASDTSSSPVLHGGLVHTDPLPTDDRDLGDGADREPLGNPWLRQAPAPRPVVTWPFVDARQHHTSTFSLDPDTASYDRLRRQVGHGRSAAGVPIRVEELINAMPYRPLPAAANAEPIALSSVTTRCPWSPQHHLLVVGVHARQALERAPMNLVFLIDVSGSMRGERLRLVQETLRLLAPTLRAEDSVALVTYSNQTTTVLPPTSGSDQAAVLAAIDGLRAGGGTRADNALVRAYETAARAHREGMTSLVVMATDGAFNQGATNANQLGQLIRRYKRRGILLELLGIGTDRGSDHRLDLLTDQADGRYRELVDAHDARRLAQAWASDGYQVAGRDAKLQVFFNPDQVAGYRLIGHHQRRLSRQDFNDDAVDGAELMHGSHAVAVYEIIPTTAAQGRVDANPFTEDVQPEAMIDPATPAALVRLRYRREGAAASVLVEQPAAAQAIADAELGDDARLAMAATTLGLLLTESGTHRYNHYQRRYETQGPTWDHLWRQLDGISHDGRPAVREFVDLAWNSHPNPRLRAGRR